MVFLPRFYFTLVTAILLALASTCVPNGMTTSLLLTLLLSCAVLADIVLIPRDILGVKRTVAPILRQSQPFQVELTVLNKGDAAASFEVLDSPPVEFNGSARMIVLRLAAKQETLQAYSLKSFRRGNFDFGAVFYRVTGPLGLIQRQGKIDLPQRVQVLPDLTGEGSRDLQLALAGAMQAGRRARGGEAQGTSDRARG